MLNLYFMTSDQGAERVQYAEVPDGLSPRESVVETCRRVAVELTWRLHSTFVIATDGTGRIICTKARRELWERSEVTPDDDAWIAQVNAGRAYDSEMREERVRKQLTSGNMRPYGRG